MTRTAIIFPAGVLVGLITLLAAEGDGWTTLPVPGPWEEVGGDRFARHDGFAWYRCFVKVPAAWKGRDLELVFQHVDDADETFVNGEKVGATGKLTPEGRSATSEPRRYPVAARLVRPGQLNLLAVRVYDHGGRGGIRGPAPLLRSGQEAIRLDGAWQFRTGDDLAWAKWPDGKVAEAKPAPGHRGVEEYEKLVREDARYNEALQGTQGLDEALRRLKAKLAETPPLSPKEALAGFTVQDGLAVDLVAAEPTVRQPLWLTFDERGRMWVVQYLQYPFPAGLKVLSYDQYIRAKFDKVPPPPPRHFKGADRITVHEDTDGDGKFDKVRTFAEGLNIATSVLPGRGGVWVLNPPYLLFYPDRDRDDVPDGDPVVHLSGFGLEDTHAVANSLAWGPDGWIYGAQGSTCTAKVKVEVRKQTKSTDFLGQAIWRYHPERHVFELFAEGGGNTFGVELDDQGRIYSGTNWGAFRGLHFVQGGYYVKGWGKHGPLTNPYALGFFQHMPHTGNGDRLTHTFVVYGGASLPERFHGKVLGPSPLQRRIQSTRLEPFLSSFKTVEEPFLMTTPDGWFRPVDSKVGPDGALYIADLYEARINHVDPRDNWDRSNGRIYRLRSRDGKPYAPFDLARLSGTELIKYLSHPNRWYRQTALRVLGDRADKELVPALRRLLTQERGQTALEALWALRVSGGFDAQTATAGLAHENPHVRAWTVRLLGDDHRLSPELGRAVIALAAKEPSPEIRSQLASSAKRFRDYAVPILAELFKRDEDVADPHIPMLVWWAVEGHAETDRADLLALLEDGAVWKRPLVEQVVLERLIQRYAMAGGRDNLLACARLLRLAPGPKHSGLLLSGLEKAFAGGATVALPVELKEAVGKAWTAGTGDARVALGLRVEIPGAVTEALRVIADEKADPKKRVEYVRILGEVEQPRAVPVLLDVLGKSKQRDVRREVLTSLQRYGDPAIGERVLAFYAGKGSDPALHESALTLLGSRAAWARQFVLAVEAGKVNPRRVPLDVVRKLKGYPDENLGKLVEKHWGKVSAATSVEKQKEVERVSAVLRGGKGDALAGKRVFAESCGKCHKLFSDGAALGPDLTGYERDSVLFWLENIVDPSAAIRDEYTNFLVTTTDGRALTGLIVEQNQQAVTLKGPDGQAVRLAREKIDELSASRVSLMPEDQLRHMNDQQVRDLFAFLMSKTPPR